MKLSPARRVLYGAALVLALIGLINLFRGFGIVEIARMPFVGGVGVPGRCSATAPGRCSSRSR